VAEGGPLVAAAGMGEGVVSDDGAPAVLEGVGEAEIGAAALLSAAGGTRDSFWVREADPESSCASAPAAAAPDAATGPAPLPSFGVPDRGSGGLTDSSLASLNQREGGSPGLVGEDQRMFKSTTAAARTATGAIHGRCR